MLFGKNQYWGTLVMQSLFCVIPVLLLFTVDTYGQSSRYWTNNFNEESSILGGAVIGGGAGPSAIYYNPANISDVENTSFSFNVSLFSVDFYKLQNALGNNIDLQRTRFRVQPRFVSLILRPEKNRNLSIEFAILNREKQEIEFTGGEESFIDIINTQPGDERYFATFRYRNDYSDDYLGAGAAYQVSSTLSLGASMFVSVKSLNYYQAIDIVAHPLSDTMYIDNIAVPTYTASATDNEYVKFTNFRLLWKFGLIFKSGNFSLGLNFTTPSLSLYSDGRNLSGKKSQSNIMNPDGEYFLPDITIADRKEPGGFKVNYKDPFSVSAGLKYDFPNGNRTLYLSASYYAGIKPYKLVDSPVNPNITSKELFDKLENKDWMSYAYGANPIVNIGVGHRWKLSDDFLLLTGFKTDFNYLKDFDYKQLNNYNRFKQINQNVFYLSGGGRINFKRVNLFAGIQYEFGTLKNRPQIINLSDPIEYNTIEQAPLQGTRQNIMKISYNSVILLFGATFRLRGVEVSE